MALGRRLRMKLSKDRGRDGNRMGLGIEISREEACSWYEEREW